MAKTYLKTESKFKVIENSRIVVCKLKCHVDLDAHDSFDLIFWNKHTKRFPNVTYNGHFTVTARVKCLPTDTFDIEKGKKLAETKARIKALSVTERIWEFYYNDITKNLKKLKLTHSKCKQVLDKELAYYASLADNKSNN